MFVTNVSLILTKLMKWITEGDNILAKFNNSIIKDNIDFVVLNNRAQDVKKSPAREIAYKILVCNQIPNFVVEM
jgi:hypothetical protein